MQTGLSLCCSPAKSGFLALMPTYLIDMLLGSYRWPDGDYAMPMSTYGCPDPDINEWKYGYMNISFWHGFELSVPSIGALGWSASNGSLKLFELLGPYGSHSIQLNFCGRFSGNGSISGNGSDQTLWPTGMYGIYGTEQNCPTGKTCRAVSSALHFAFCLVKNGQIISLRFKLNNTGR